MTSLRLHASLVFLVLPFLSPDSSAQAPKTDITVLRVPPKTPEEERQSFVIQPGFAVELVAAEPLVQSPICVEFDEDGRMWVIELPEYNAYAGTKPQGKGRVVVLTDTNGDGIYDTRTVFADNLDYPTGLACWNGGVYVGVAPDLIYMKDTNGDGKADIREVILTGFGKDKAGEAQLNSFRWTLEQRILISTGMDGGEISVPGKPEIKSVSVRNMNILLDPRTNTFELTSGGGQHGMTLDDWGHVFVCGNSDPIHMMMYDARYLLRNPTVPAPPAATNILPSGKFTKLHRISEVEPWRQARTQLRKSGLVPGSDEGGTPSGFFTAATGITVYRGDAFPEEIRGNIFVGEAANNLLFRAKLKPKGVGYEAERADETREFFASKDVWFRPVQMANAPDGCLYVVDMYRELIEGAAFLPPQVLKQVDPSAGFDKGRIWRIVPEGTKRRANPTMSKMTSAELVKLLEHPNGWHRDTASRVLYQRNDKTILEDLERLINTSQVLPGGAAAVWLAYRMDGVVRFGNLKNLTAQNPRWREQLLAIQGFFPDLTPPNSSGGTPRTALNKSFEDGHRDPDNEYRYRYAFIAGRYPSRVTAAQYTQMAFSDSADPWMRLAILAGQENTGRAKTFEELMDSREFRRLPHGRILLAQMADVLGADPNGDYALLVMKAVSTAAISDSALARDLYKAFRSRASTRTVDRLMDVNVAPTVKALTNRLLGEAVVTARDGKKSPEERAAAIKDLTMATFDDTLPIIKECLQSAQPPEVQRAALQTLGMFGSDKVPALILEGWTGMSPQVRATATEVFLSRGEWITAFLDAVEAKKIARGDVDPARVELLKKSPARVVGVRAAKLFGASASNRQQVFESYRKALELKGDSVRGKVVFKNNCAACHQLENVGENIGADLKAIKDRGLESVMLNILDPNREVKPQYLTYAAELKNGRLVTGMITQETASGLTIRRPDGTSEAIARSQIDQLRSSGLSYMPEGLEKQIDLPAMADLLAYLSSIK
ncbi:PVC-type heme-binding CxxCH protein [Zavarzinella formosa]|uniref:PVC-type heme-binding CxxCH protein n=1 Tax=Zavarzinella formosa TaxID=360055 RepID=UPI0002E53659|nr:PVC-type heme-binding CxxCH protein [Zavarzinella formosa]